MRLEYLGALRQNEGSQEEGDRKWGRLGVAGELSTWETVNKGTQGSGQRWSQSEGYRYSDRKWGSRRAEH